MRGDVGRGRSRLAGWWHRLRTIVDIIRAQAVAGRQGELEVWAFELVDSAMGDPDGGSLDRAIEAIRRILTHVDHPSAGDRLAYLVPLTMALRRRFERRKMRADLDEAAFWCEESTGLAAVSDRVPAHFEMPDLVQILETRHEHYGDIDDLERAVATSRRLIELLGGDDLTPQGEAEELADALGTLARLLLVRFGRTARAEDLAEAADLAESAVAHSHTDPVRKGVYLSLLGSSRLNSYEQTGADRDLDRCVDAYREVLALASDGRATAEDFSNLGIALQSRFERTGELADLHEAIRLGKEAVAALPDDAPDRGDYLTNLGGAIYLRFEHNGLLEDLDEAVECQRDAYASHQASGAPAPLSAGNLANALRVRYQRTGDVNDLADAEVISRGSVAAGPVRFVDRGLDDSELGVTLATRFELNGDPADLDGAIAQLRRSLAVISPGHFRRPMLLSNLSFILLLRYTSFGASLTDLEDAVALGRLAVTTCSPQHINRGLYLSNLGNALITHYQRTDTLLSLQEATEVQRAAVTATAQRPHWHPMALVNLAQLLMWRYGAANEPEALDESIAVGRQALSAYPFAHIQRMLCAGNLAAALLTRYQLGTKAHDDLTEALALNSQAVASIHPGNPARARLLQNHAVALRERFQLFGDPTDLTEAWRCWREASEAATSPVEIRARAAASWGLSAATLGSAGQALAGYTAAVTLLPTLAWRGADRDDNEYALTQAGGLATDAAAWAVTADAAEQAIWLLESGRAVLWSQVLADRNALDGLSVVDARLATRLRLVSQALNRSRDASTGPPLDQNLL